MAARKKQRNKQNRGVGSASQRVTAAGTKRVHEAPTDETRSTLESGKQQLGESLELGKGAIKGAVAELRGPIESGVAGAKRAAREGAEKASDLVREAQTSARETGRSVLGFAGRNPVPTALAGVGAACTGIGVAWMLMGERRRKSTDGAGDNGASARDVTLRATKGTRRLAKRAQSSISGAAHDTAERVHRMARDARAEGQLLGEVAEKRFRDHPLAVGAAMMAIGTAVGVALPSTMRERLLLGGRREALIARARQAARGAIHKVESVANPTAATSS